MPLVRRWLVITVTQTPVPRDRWGAPIVDGSRYRRASSLAVDDKQGLLRWAAGMAALGAAQSSVIRNRILTIDRQSPTWKKDLYQLGQQARDLAGSGDAAADGTSIHRATELADTGQGIDQLPTQLREAVDRYQRLLAGHGLIPLAAEVFVACPSLQVAGTLDRLVLCPDGAVRVLDLKTSGPDAGRYAGLSWATQIAAYSRSDPYCHDRGWLTWPDVGLVEPDGDTGLVAHVPQDGSPARLWSVDLAAGWEAARTAVVVHTQRRATYLTDITVQESTK